MKSKSPTAALASWGVPSGELFVIAGPCSAETREQVMRTAAALVKHKVHLFRAGIWKPRTRPGSFEGVGSQGLAWLREARAAHKLPITVEVASPGHVQECLEARIDVLWIGARTTTNPILVNSIAGALRGIDIPVMIKNPVNPDIGLWIGALERFDKAGVKRLAAVHRGFSRLGKGAFRNDPVWRIPIELKRLRPGLPMICDPSHICGVTESIPLIAQMALDLLFDGLMIESHIDPGSALSDAEQQLTPEELGELLHYLIRRDPSSADNQYLAHIKRLRNEIDEIDGDIIGLLVARMAAAREIAVHQKRNNVSLFQPDRWEKTLQSRRRQGAARGLSPEFVGQLYQLIHEETLRHKEAAEPDAGSGRA